MALAGCFGALSGVATCFHWMPRDSLGCRVSLTAVTEIVSLQVQDGYCVSGLGNSLLLGLGVGVCKEHNNIGLTWGIVEGVGGQL